jgi:hypothetical protein
MCDVSRKETVPGSSPIFKLSIPQVPWLYLSSRVMSPVGFFTALQIISRLPPSGTPVFTAIKKMKSNLTNLSSLEGYIAIKPPTIDSKPS